MNDELERVKRIGAQQAYPGCLTALGMTFRQYAAVAAMQGWISCPGLQISDRQIAEGAVRMADFLIAELSREV